MKKILAILAVAFAGAAFAGDSATLEYQAINNKTSADQKLYSLSVKHDLSKTLTGDVLFSNAQTDGTGSLSTRLEGGLTASTPLVGSVKGYVRGGVGQKFSNDTSFGYYSIEPGVTFPVTGALSAKVGVRYRSATDSTVNNDQTHAVRTSVSYALSNKSAIGLGYDRVRGDSEQNNFKVNYTRGF